jgi:alkanesulfonate monooxygenase SsuD/methylene tetrahydromethanopterin reductase-like flavin-dependent oxidoreductase (luciferase family)
VIIGGRGPKRTPALAARFGDEFNVPFASVDATRDTYALVAAACEKDRPAGRAPLVYSVAQTIACGRTEAEAEKRHRRFGPPPLHGTPDQVVDQIGRFAELGATRVFLQILDMTDLDHLDVIASEVAPQLP